jgi:hypothetical protein
MTTIHLLPEFVAYIQQEKLEVTKGVIRSHKSKKGIQYTGQKTNNGLQNIKQKNKDRATRTPLKLELNKK